MSDGFGAASDNEISVESAAAVECSASDGFYTVRNHKITGEAAAV